LPKRKPTLFKGRKPIRQKAKHTLKNSYAHNSNVMKKTLTLHIHIQKNIVNDFEKHIEKTGLKPGTYINELIRQDLSLKGEF